MNKTKKTILRLSVPQSNERGPLAFEQILASLHGLLIKEIKKSSDESISFEIVRSEKRIFFYIVIPSHLRTLISSQFYSQYPEVEIETVSEYFTKKLVKDKQLLIADIAPKELWIFPFKRHPQFEDSTTGNFEDPLGPMTAALSHLHGKDDTALLQFIIAPVPTSWNKTAQSAIENMSKSGMWKWSWVQRAYQWSKLSPGEEEKFKKTLTRIGLSLLSKFFGGSKPETSEEENQEGKTSSKHEKEGPIAAAQDKISRLNFSVNIRTLYIHSDPDTQHAEAKIREIAGTFQQFALPKMNRFGVTKLERDMKSKLFKDIISRKNHNPFVLSQEELATIFHLPTKTVSSPRIQWVLSQRLEPPVDLPDEKEGNVTIIGETNFRNQHEQYGIRTNDRRRHVYIIGKTGMGKSTLLENMIFSDIKDGKGVAVIDPHGDLAEAVLRFVPKNRTNDVIYFDPADKEFPIAFNMLEGKNAEKRSLVASGLLGVFKKLYSNSWGPRLEHFLRNTILALVEAPDTTMLGIPRMLVDKIYREKVLHFVTDPMVQSFWRTEFSGGMSPQKMAEAVSPIQNKVGQFLSTPTIRNILGQTKSSLDLRFAMDSGKIIIVNLSKGKIGEDNSSLLGSLLITKFQLDAMSRADIREKDRKDFYLYVDEFQNFATDSFATILSEARKYRLNLTMANQYVAQMSEEVRDAVFGNVGSLISFQIGFDDAKIFSEQFDEKIVKTNDLIGLPKYHVYNRILVEGITTQVFSGKTLPPPSIISEEDPEERRDKVVKFSRQRYAKPREIVEEKIARWTRPEEEKYKKRKEEEQKKKAELATSQTNIPSKNVTKEVKNDINPHPEKKSENPVPNSIGAKEKQ